MNFDSRIYVAGHNGLVGSSIVRLLENKGYNNIFTSPSTKLNLMDINKVDRYFEQHRPQYVFLAAAKVGGILANKDCPADFIYDNLAIQNNIIYTAYKYHVEKLLFLGSSCIYPRDCPQPIKEEYLMTGKLESTNDAYAIAKIAGIKLCQSFNRQYKTNFISVMPTNLYGQNDNFSLLSSHVLPALINKFHDAKVNNKDYIVVWGSGNPQREFLHVDDLASACVFLMNKYNSDLPINIGWGKDISINDLANLIGNIIGYTGNIRFDKSKPDGVKRKVLDVTKLFKLGWRPYIDLEMGIKMTYDWYTSNLV